MKKFAALVLALLMLMAFACAEAIPQVTISFRTENGDETVLQAQLFDTEAALALACMENPVFLMADLNGDEKFTYLPQSLTESPELMETVKAGDILLFGNKCLVIFYQDAASAFGYTPVGRILNPELLPQLLGKGDVQVTFLFDEVK